MRGSLPTKGNAYYNPTTKVLIAAENWIGDLKSEKEVAEAKLKEALEEVSRLKEAGEDEEKEEVGPNKVVSDDSARHWTQEVESDLAQDTKSINADEPTEISKVPELVWNQPGIEPFAQAANRAIQMAEEKYWRADGGTGGGGRRKSKQVSKELNDVLETATEFLIDVVDAIEQEGMSDDNRKKWAARKQELGLTYYLQRP
jgi:hypothetical protein